MMTTLKKILAAIFVSITWINIAVAQSIDVVPVDRTILKIRTQTNSAAILYDPPNQSVLGCNINPVVSDKWLVIDWSGNKTNAKAMYATVMTAFVLNKPFGFAAGQCNSFAGGVPQAARIDIGQ